MARRKKQVKRKVSRRRRMGATGGGLMSALYLVGGAAAAQLVGKAIDKAMASSTMDDMTKKAISGAAPVVAGYFLPKFIKGDVGAKLGAGMIAVGGLKLVQSAGVLGGMNMGAINYYSNKPVSTIAGYQGASTGTYIAGIKNAASLEQC
jgi:hypothetical protein